jgi:hypothetical protein
MSMYPSIDGSLATMMRHETGSGSAPGANRSKRIALDVWSIASYLYHSFVVANGERDVDKSVSSKLRTAPREAAYPNMERSHILVAAGFRLHSLPSVGVANECLELADGARISLQRCIACCEGGCIEGRARPSPPGRPIALAVDVGS